jgi:hypothetical protein
MKKSYLAAALGCAALLSGAGISQTEAAAPAKAPKPKTDCFFNSQVTNFAAKTDQTLYVKAGRDVYRFDMFGRCMDMNNALNIGLDSSPSSSICAATDVTVVVHADGLGPQRCPVRTITKLTAEEVAALPKGEQP